MPAMLVAFLCALLAAPPADATLATNAGLTQYTVGSTAYTITWVNKAPLPVAVSDATASTVGDKIYLIGGCDSEKGNEKVGTMHACTDIANHVLIYTPGGDQWTLGGVMPHERYRHAAAVVGTDIYVVGGRDVSDNIVKSVLKYSTSAGSWSQVGGMFEKATSDNAAFSYSGKVYTCGGYTADYSKAVRDCFAMDPSVALPAFVSLQLPLGQGRGDFRIVGLGAWAYAIGGFNSAFTALNSVEKLSFESMAGWVSTNVMMIHGRGDFAAVAYKQRLLVMGGENGTDSLTAGASLRHVEAFSPATDAWLSAEKTVPIPFSTFRFCGAAHGDAVYIFGGQTAFSQVCDCYPTKKDVFSYTEATAVSTSRAFRKASVASLLLAAVGQWLLPGHRAAVPA